jgi:hypothetical protein
MSFELQKLLNIIDTWKINLKTLMWLTNEILFIFNFILKMQMWLICAQIWYMYKLHATENQLLSTSQALAHLASSLADWSVNGFKVSSSALVNSDSNTFIN